MITLDPADRAALAEAGLDLALVAHVVAGAAAAPVAPHDPEGWLDLLHPGGREAVPERLRARLSDLRRRHAVRVEPGDAATLAARLAALRAALARAGLDGLIVPRADRHQGEYVPAADLRLAWISGFDGSAGSAIILTDGAALFTDGRYTLQAARQTPAALFEHHHVTDSPPEAWLARRLARGARLGFDPWLHTPAQIERLEAALERCGATLVAAEPNPLDLVWTERPAAPLAPVRPHPLAFAGQPHEDKLAALGARLAEAGCAAAVLTQPDGIAWTLNLRGGDVPSTPLPLALAILHAPVGEEGARLALYLDPAKLAPETRAHLGNRVVVEGEGAFDAALDRLGAARARVRLDPQLAPVRVARRLAAAGAVLDRGEDPTLAPKAAKNAAELAGAFACHRRDGVAVVRFLHWLDEAARRRPVNELEAAERITALRAEDPLFRDESFPPIAGAGPNGAIVHYRVTAETSRTLGAGELFLIDSGAQYQDGTTDVTRTVFVPPGTPTPLMRRQFTLVLKGMIAVARQLFPRGATGAQLDTLARQFLWQARLDFDHGTGHGVGSYLSVHEGPQRIAKAGTAAALVPGMIVSDEPGCYRPGAWGIRCENLLVVEALPPGPPAGGDRAMLGFRTLTLAPFDRRLIDPALLTPKERRWLDAYHAEVAAALTPALPGPAAAWLAAATAPL